MPHFSHLLVPLDGSRLAETALPTAIGFAAGVGAKVTLLHVLERGAPHKVHGEPHLADAKAGERYLEEVARLHATFDVKGDVKGSVEIGCHVHANEENDVAASIVEHAKEFSADLIALTPHGRPDLRRWLIGSIPQLVLQRGATPVLFVPPGKGSAARFTLRDLLVPLEGHDAESVLQVAQMICGAFDAQAHLVRVVPTLSTLRGDSAATALLTPSATSATLDIQQQTAREYLSDIVDKWPLETQPGVEVLRGEPAQTILNRIKHSQPDLTLMSTHGKSGLSGLWAASVAAKVVARSSRPLLLIRVGV